MREVDWEWTQKHANQNEADLLGVVLLQFGHCTSVGCSFHLVRQDLLPPSNGVEGRDRGVVRFH